MKKGYVIRLIGMMAALMLVVLLINSLASLEQARANEHTARAVQTAMASQALMTTVLSGLIVLLGLVVVVLSVVVAALVMRSRRAQLNGNERMTVQTRPGKWLPGPNARWGRQLPAGGEVDQISPETMARAIAIARMMDTKGTGAMGTGGGSGLTIRHSEGEDDPYEELFG